MKSSETLRSGGRRLEAAGVVAASTVGTTMSVTPAVSAVLGTMLIPISQDFGWSRTAVSSAAAVVAFSTAAAYPFAGWLCDRIGPRLTAIIGTLALGLSIISLYLAQADEFFFFLQFAAIGAAGALPSAVTYGKLLAQWFESRRGLWMGIAGMGNGIGVAMFPLLAALTLDAFGWRGAYLCIGLIVAVVGVSFQVLFLRNAPRASREPAAALESTSEADDPVEGLTFGEALRSWRFWMLLSAMPLCGGALMAAVHMTVPLLDSRGIPTVQAAQVMTSVGLAAIAGEAFIGFLLDRADNPRILTPVYLMGVAGLLLLLYGSGQAVFLLAGMFLGVAIAGEFTALSFLLSRYFGLRSLGAISGFAFSAVLLVSALMTVVLNAVFDLVGSYAWAILAMMPLLGWNAFVPLILGRYVFIAGDET